MNPAIVYPEGRRDEAFLIDLHSVVGTSHGKPTQLALRAIQLKYLKAGDIAVIDGVTYPRPCQLGAFEAFRTADPRSLGIYPDAAVALLSMKLGYETRIAPGENFKAGKAAAGFKQWPFLIAWCWSAWQEAHRTSDDGFDLERRWQQAKALGFPDTFSSFRQICSRLNLSVTKSGPSM